ncbi:hypothetical protein ACVIW0_005526 [Bradyrhizobium sp. USDA 4454]
MLTEREKKLLRRLAKQASVDKAVQHRTWGQTMTPVLIKYGK